MLGSGDIVATSGGVGTRLPGNDNAGLTESVLSVRVGFGDVGVDGKQCAMLDEVHELGTLGIALG